MATMDDLAAQKESLRAFVHAEYQRTRSELRHELYILRLWFFAMLVGLGGAVVAIARIPL